MAELTHEAPRPGATEKIARWGVFALLLVALVSVAFGLGYVVKDARQDDAQSSRLTVTPGGTTASGADSVGAAILDEILQILETQYVDRNSIDPEVLRDGAITGILNALNDPHTSYLTADAMKRGSFNLAATYQGIGASVTDRNGQVEIISPFRGSPAETAGIRVGDIVLEVDGERTDGWSDQEAVQRIRGVKGTPVTLKVQHTDGKVETITVVRGEIDIQSVFTEPNLEVIPGESGLALVDRDGQAVKDIGYINISQFHEKTASEVKTALQQVQSKGYKSLILDLRGNPGGLLSATIDVADEFLDSGTVLIEVDKDGKRKTYSARSGGLATRIPIVILQDAGSASGAEVLAAALRDNGRAKIIGTNSFGKGTVNQLQPLKNCGDPAGCGALYVSIGRWLTPKGEQIEGVGVAPDIELELTSKEYVESGDLQIFRAIEVLRTGR